MKPWNRVTNATEEGCLALKSIFINHRSSLARVFWSGINRPIIRRMPCAAQCFSFHCFSRHWPLFFVSPKEFQQFFICVQMKLSYVLFQLFLSFIIFCLLDLIICSKTTLNGWFRKPNAHEKHTGQNKRIVPKCITALLIPEFFSLSKLQETFTKNTLGKKKG